MVEDAWRLPNKATIAMLEELQLVAMSAINVDSLATLPMNVLAILIDRITGFRYCNLEHGTVLRSYGVNPLTCAYRSSVL